MAQKWARKLLYKYLLDEIDEGHTAGAEAEPPAPVVLENNVVVRKVKGFLKCKTLVFSQLESNSIQLYDISFPLTH